MISPQGPAPDAVHRDMSKMQNAQQVPYGTRRLVIAAEGCAAEYRGCSDQWPLDLLQQAAVGQRPFTYLAVEQRGWYDWKVVSSIQTRPQPSWAHPSANFCRVCGVVAFDGAALPCCCR